MRRAALATLLVLSCSAALGQQPPPEFDSGYEAPALELKATSPALAAGIKVGLLAVALGLAAWLVHWRRSRRWVVVLTVASLVYFGFLERGCICPVGSIQNVVLALTSNYAIPVAVLFIFMLPLLASLVFGRVFCAAVCPLGCLQDVVIAKPVQVPRWLDKPLGLGRYLVLGAAVFGVTAGGRFLVCEFDPLVPFFRLSDFAWMIIAGVAVLLLGLVVARPYCRYVCPYGAILSITSRQPTWRMLLSPEDCINCTLCESACPFGAIRPPRPEPKRSRSLVATTWGAAVAAVAALAIGGWMLGGMFDHALAGSLLGGWSGLVIAAGSFSFLYERERKTYEIDQTRCLACGRCFSACPKERKRIGMAAAERPGTKSVEGEGASS